MKKPGADKIALLGFLVLALIIAHLIIISKSTVKFSGPIKLICDNLSVSLPSGNGWQNENQWRYHENTFAVSSIFISGRGSVTAMANCRYLLAPPAIAADIQCRQKALAMNGTIEKTGQITTGKLTFDWALIKKRTMPLKMFFGITSLPNNRQVNIELFHTEDNAERAEQIFKNLADHLRVKNNTLLEAGGKTVTELKNKQISSLLENRSYESFFIITDTKGNPAGFTIDMFAAGNQTPLNIEGTSSFYLQRPLPEQQIISFKSDDGFNEFTCRADSGSVFGAKTTEVQLDKITTVTVRKLAPPAEKKIYHVGPAAVPEFFIDQLLSQFLDSTYKQIIVDIIEADGKIVPALISRTDITGADDKDNASYLLNMEILDGSGSSQKTYLNSRKQILKISLQQKDLYVLEKTDLENIVKQFPEQAGYVLDRSRFLKQRQQ